jgi:hypothetical protein
VNPLEDEAIDPKKAWKIVQGFCVAFRDIGSQWDKDELTQRIAFIYALAERMARND